MHGHLSDRKCNGIKSALSQSSDYGRQQVLRRNRRGGAQRGAFDYAQLSNPCDLKIGWRDRAKEAAKASVILRLQTFMFTKAALVMPERRQYTFSGIIFF